MQLINNSIKLKNAFLLVSLVLSGYVSMAQLQSPDQFLGYKLGSRFTAHAQVVNYFEHVAKFAPQKVKLQY